MRLGPKTFSVVLDREKKELSNDHKIIEKKSRTRAKTWPTIGTAIRRKIHFFKPNSWHVVSLSNFSSWSISISYEHHLNFIFLIVDCIENRIPNAFCEALFIVYTRIKDVWSHVTTISIEKLIKPTTNKLVMTISFDSFNQYDRILFHVWISYIFTVLHPFQTNSICIVYNDETWILCYSFGNCWFIQICPFNSMIVIVLLIYEKAIDRCYSSVSNPRIYQTKTDRTGSSRRN